MKGNHVKTMKTITESWLIVGLLLTLATVSFGQTYGPGNRYNQGYPNGYNNGYGQPYPNQSYPNGNGYSPNYPNGYNNGYEQPYPNGYPAYDQYGRPYPVQPPVVIVPPRVVIVPSPPPVVIAPAPIFIRPYNKYGYGYYGSHRGYGRRRW